MKEEWRDVPGFVGIYQASNKGRVRSLDRIVFRGKLGAYTRKGRIIRTSTNNKGYETIQLNLNGLVHSTFVHRVVASAFLGEQPEMQVNHIDGDKRNNKLTNLEWVTGTDNIRHSVLNKLSSSQKLDISTVRKIKTAVGMGASYKSIEMLLGISRKHVSEILRGKRWGWVK